MLKAHFCSVSLLNCKLTVNTIDKLEKVTIIGISTLI